MFELNQEVKIPGGLTGTVMSINHTTETPAETITDENPHGVATTINQVSVKYTDKKGVEKTEWFDQEEVKALK